MTATRLITTSVPTNVSPRLQTNVSEPIAPAKKKAGAIRPVNDHPRRHAGEVLAVGLSEVTIADARAEG
jgi:hypothetical protein